VCILEMNGLSMREIVRDSFDLPVIFTEKYLGRKPHKVDVSKLWKVIHRGDLPELYQNPDMDWSLYYASYIATYIDRDARMIINIKELANFSVFMIALAARTSQLLNYQAMATEVGVDIHTIKSWVRILETSGIIAIVQPFSNNKLSRAIKTPRVYFMNTGLACYLLKWNTPETLMNGAMSGQILETYVVSEIIKSFKNTGIINAPICFYRDRDQKEIDLIVESNGILYPIEIKRVATPKAAMIKNATLLEKAQGFKVGTKMIMCLVDKKMYLATDVIAYPITEI